MSVKPWLESLDLLVKIIITVVVFLIWGGEKERLAIQREQAATEKTLAEASAKTAEAKQTTQGTNLVIVNRLLDLFGDIRKDCLSDDRMYMVTFLVDVNNSYNDVKFKPEAINSILTAEQHCTSLDAKDVQSTGLGAGSIPVVTPQNIEQLNNSLKSKAPVLPSSGELPDGYVAVGFPEKGFQNFSIVSLQPGGAGANIIVPQTLLRANSSVYLRSNYDNTETGRNAIRGVIQENQCVRVLVPYPGIRGQTWAAVKLADCGDHR